MDIGVRPLWAPMPRVAGRAFTVRCRPGDNLMLHAAIHRAPRGSIVVVQSGDPDYALAGGNVCAVAQRNGIAAFVLDGVIRDLGRGARDGIPRVRPRRDPDPGDEDGHRTARRPGALRRGRGAGRATSSWPTRRASWSRPMSRAEQTLLDARARLAQEAGETLDAWAEAHRARIDTILSEHDVRD